VIQRKPGALRNGAPFTQLPEAFKRLQSQLGTPINPGVMTTNMIQYS